MCQEVMDMLHGPGTYHDMQKGIHFMQTEMGASYDA